MNGFVHSLCAGVQFGEQTLSPGPVSTTPHRGIDTQLCKCRQPDFTLDGRPHHKRPDTNSEFTQSNFYGLQRNSIVYSSRYPYTATHTFSLDASNYEFGTGSHSVDHMSKPTEEMQSLFFVFDCL